MADVRGKSPAAGGGGRRAQAGPADAGARQKQLLEEIRAGKPRAAYLCFGDDYLAEQAAHALIAGLVPEADRGTNLERFSGDALDPGALMGSLRTRPLFGGRKVAAVYGATFLASRESAGELLEAASGAWEEGDQDRGARLFLRALAVAEVDQEEFDRPEWPERLSSEPEKVLPKVGRDILRWVPAVRAHCLERGLAIPKASDVGDLLEAELSKGFPAGNVLVLVASVVDQRRRLFKALEAGGGAVGFAVERKKETELPRDVLRRELQARAAGAGKRVPPDVAEAIVQRAGASLRGFSGELEKLFTYAGARETLTKEDVEEAFGDRAEPYLFDLTNALGERDLERALHVLRALLAHGAEPIYLLNLLAGEVRRLIQAREALDGPLKERWQPPMEYGAFQARVWEPGKAAAASSPDPSFFAMHPFRAFNMLRGASRFAMEELTGAIERLFEADLHLKSTGLDPARLLETALFDLCRPAEKSPAGETAGPPARWAAEPLRLS